MHTLRFFCCLQTFPVFTPWAIVPEASNRWGPIVGPMTLCCHHQQQSESRLSNSHPYKDKAYKTVRGGHGQDHVANRTRIPEPRDRLADNKKSSEIRMFWKPSPYTAKDGT